MTTHNPNLSKYFSGFSLLSDQNLERNAVKNSSTATFSLHNVDDPQISAIWKDFLIGMQFLEDNISRTNANLEVIAKSNIKLLHKNLLRAACYSRFLAINTNTNRGPLDEESLQLVNMEKIKGSVYKICKDRSVSLTPKPASLLDEQSGNRKRSRNFYMNLVVSGITKISKSANEQLISEQTVKSPDIYMSSISSTETINMRSVSNETKILHVELINFNDMQPKSISYSF